MLQRDKTSLDRSTKAQDQVSYERILVRQISREGPCQSVVTLIFCFVFGHLEVSFVK